MRGGLKFMDLGKNMFFNNKRSGWKEEKVSKTWKFIISFKIHNLYQFGSVLDNIVNNWIKWNKYSRMPRIRCTSIITLFRFPHLFSHCTTIPMGQYLRYSAQITHSGTTRRAVGITLIIIQLTISQFIKLYQPIMDSGFKLWGFAF